MSQLSSTAPSGFGHMLRSSAQCLIALGVTGAFLAYLLIVPAGRHALPADDTSQDPAASVAGPNLLQIKPDGPLKAKIAIASVRQETRTDPLLLVSGRVVASLRPGKLPSGTLLTLSRVFPSPMLRAAAIGARDEDYWQFDAPEVLTTYNDWLKARSDIEFTQKQLVQVRKLADVRLDAQKRVVERLQKLVDAGTDTLKDLTAERANLLQIEITGKKDIHEAETAVRVARRNDAAMARQLQQAGLDPDMLLGTTSDIDVVMADVPEGKLSRVKVGQGVQAKFFGVPGEIFKGQVSSIAPVLSKERRSLRVLFAILDLKDQLRSGMFAEIGIGTDPRETLLMPAEGILHIGRGDYALAAGTGDTWRIVEVQVGEPHGGDIEILQGLKAGEKVLGKGAILLKPLVVRALAMQSKPA